MATQNAADVPLSQNLPSAQLAWQNRPQRVPQFTSPDIPAGAPNPDPAPPVQSQMPAQPQTPAPAAQTAPQPQRSSTRLGSLYGGFLAALMNRGGSQQRHFHGPEGFARMRAEFAQRDAGQPSSASPSAFAAPQYDTTPRNGGGFYRNQY
jgi:hypothetical protein